MERNENCLPIIQHLSDYLEIQADMGQLGFYRSSSSAHLQGNYLTFSMILWIQAGLQQGFLLRT